MHEDKARWNEKYKSKPMPDEASEILKKNLHLAKKGRALDIACGMGRNTRYLAEQGFKVDAVDLSDYALSRLEDRETINKIEADLDSYEFETEAYELILKINYLDRNIFAKIIAALKEGGIFIYETFVETPTAEEYHKPTRAEFHLKRGELLMAFAALEIISYEEKDAINLRGEKVRVASLVAAKRQSRQLL